MAGNDFQTPIEKATTAKQLKPIVARAKAEADKRIAEKNKKDAQFRALDGTDYVISNIIKLVEQRNIKSTKAGYVSDRPEYVAFKVQPEVSEAKSVSYVDISEIRAPGSIMFFMGSPARTFSLEVKLISRSTEEARGNFLILNTLKGWTMPDSTYISHDSINDDSQMAGAPRILKLFGYGNVFKGIPVVIKSLNVTYPTDCDYIQSGGARMPLIMPISIQLQEMRSAAELEKFNIGQYRDGVLPLW